MLRKGSAKFRVFSGLFFFVFFFKKISVFSLTFFYAIHGLLSPLDVWDIHIYGNANFFFLCCLDRKKKKKIIKC